MKDKFIRVSTTILFLTITLTLFFSPDLLAKPSNPNKPDKPEKPEEPLPNLVEADFKIWIGNGDLASPEDMVLQPYGDPVINYLFVEDYLGGSWIPQATKGKAPREGWGITLGRVNMGNTAAPYGGTYDINDQSLLDVLNLQGDFNVNDQDIYMLFIGRYIKAYLMEDDPKPSNVDYWHMEIVWETDSTVEVPNPWGEPDPMIVSHRYFLDGKTNIDVEPEGVYDGNTDAWTVTFETVFELFENTDQIDPEGRDVHNKLWEGPLSFTVKIQRILS